MRIHHFVMLLILIFSFSQCVEENNTTVGGTYSLWDGISKTRPDSFDITAKVIVIKQASELAWLADATNTDSLYDGFYGYHISLAADLDLGGKYRDASWSSSGGSWIPIGTSENGKEFKGSFDGAGYKIRNIVVENSDAKELGLFGCVSGQLSNVIVESGCVRALFANKKRYVGAICGYIKVGGLLSNCSNKAAVCTADSITYMGGICGYADAPISNSVNGGKLYAKEQSATDSCFKLIVGGIAGFSNKTITVCENYGTILSSARDSTYAGGICGQMNAEIGSCVNKGKLGFSPVETLSRVIIGGICAQNRMIVRDCENKGIIEAYAGAPYVGGICAIGNLIIDCVNRGGLSVTSDALSFYIGGISYLSNEITRCNNYGAIEAATTSSVADCYMAGIGVHYKTVSYCMNEGVIYLTTSVRSGYVGGIATILRAGQTGGTILHCWNKGRISIPSSEAAVVGGIVSSTYSTTIFGCINEGVLYSRGSGASYVGGILGEARWSDYTPTCKIMACVNTGSFNVNVTEAGGLYGRGAVFVRSAFSVTPSYGISTRYRGSVADCYFSADRASMYELAGAKKFSTTAWPDSTMPGWGSVPPSDWNQSIDGIWESPWASLGSWNNGTPVYPQLKIQTQ